MMRPLLLIGSAMICDCHSAFGHGARAAAGERITPT